MNGRVVTELGTRVDPATDDVQVDGASVEAERTTWIALHKPRGAVTTRSDPRGRRTVYDSLPERFHTLFHVGRLDRQSEGLLLLTNDGATAHRLTHPSFGVRRVYNVRTERTLSDADFERLAKGVRLEEGFVAPVALERTQGTRSDRGGGLRITLTEGRNREIRRMIEAVGHSVVRLRRIRYGPIALGGLPPGQWRELAPPEIEALEAAGARKPRTRNPRGRRAGHRPTPT